MSRSKATNKPNPAKPDARAAAALLNAALTSAYDDLQSARAERSEALRDVVNDPTGTAARVGKADARIKEAEARIATLNDALAQAQAEASAAYAAGRRAAAAADCAKVIELANERVEIAKEIDAALAAARAAVERYAENGRAGDAAARRALESVHGGDMPRMLDAMVVVLPKAGGTGEHVAVALGHHVRALATLLNVPSIENHVSVSHYLPKGPATLQAAAQFDVDALTARFGGAR